MHDVTRFGNFTSSSIQSANRTKATRVTFTKFGIFLPNRHISQFLSGFVANLGTKCKLAFLSQNEGKFQSYILFSLL